MSLYCYGAILSFALVVRTPFNPSLSQKDNLENLRSWIIKGAHAGSFTNLNISPCNPYLREAH